MGLNELAFQIFSERMEEFSLNGDNKRIQRSQPLDLMHKIGKEPLKNMLDPHGRVAKEVEKSSRDQAKSARDAQVKRYVKWASANKNASADQKKVMRNKYATNMRNITGRALDSRLKTLEGTRVLRIANVHATRKPFNPNEVRGELKAKDWQYHNVRTKGLDGKTVYDKK